MTALHQQGWALHHLPTSETTSTATQMATPSVQALSARSDGTATPSTVDTSAATMSCTRGEGSGGSGRLVLRSQGSQCASGPGVSDGWSNAAGVCHGRGGGRRGRHHSAVLPSSSSKGHALPA